MANPSDRRRAARVGSTPAVAPHPATTPATPAVDHLTPGLCLTIAYVTFRQNPRFEWFAASLARELRDTGVNPACLQVVVVDGRLWHDSSARRIHLADLVGGRFPLEHVAPKPTVWQGPWRLTSRDYFSASSTRNTALARARAPHVAFVDDLSVLMPGWLAAQLDAAARGIVLLGLTDKRLDVTITPAGGYIFADHPAGTDSRHVRFSGDEAPAPGAWLYGGTFSVPLATALAVNGFDEVCEGIGGEDYDFGIRVERTRTPIYISRRCATVEDEKAHYTEVATAIRLDKPWAGPDGPYSSNALLHKLSVESRSWTVGNHFNLRELRSSVLSGCGFPIPTEPRTHWVDGQPLIEM